MRDSFFLFNREINSLQGGICPCFHSMGACILLRQYRIRQILESTKCMYASLNTLHIISIVKLGAHMIPYNFITISYLPIVTI